jgi:HD-GYP domain-containing protein (c-di-GMP phosphodiesterase class II)
MLHDIGKLYIPREILKKPSQLTVYEFEEIKRHTILGYDILKKSDRLNMTSAYIALGHHERYDGSGYPLHLKSEGIQIFARIVAVADVYDALTSDRVYRKKLKPHEVYEYITSLGIYHFDPKVVESLSNTLLFILSEQAFCSIQKSAPLSSVKTGTCLRGLWCASYTMKTCSVWRCPGNRPF